MNSASVPPGRLSSLSGMRHLIQLSHHPSTLQTFEAPGEAERAPRVVAAPPPPLPPPPAPAAADPGRGLAEGGDPAAPAGEGADVLAQAVPAVEMEAEGGPVAPPEPEPGAAQPAELAATVPQDPAAPVASLEEPAARAVRAATAGSAAGPAPAGSPPAAAGPRAGVDRAGADDWIAKNCKDCPRCSAPCELVSGCPHVTCARCKLEFCFGCRKPWQEIGGYSHRCRGEGNPPTREARPGLTSVPPALSTICYLSRLLLAAQRVQLLHIHAMPSSSRLIFWNPRDALLLLWLAGACRPVPPPLRSRSRRRRCRSSSRHSHAVCSWLGR